MFDLRYHVASLAAVFIALAVGVLLGVAISGNLSETQKSLERSRISQLSAALSRERGRADIIERRGASAQELLDDAYPLLLQDRLAGRSFALLFVGPVQGEIRSDVERTLADAGAGAPVRMVSLDTPVSAGDIDDTLMADEDLASYAQNGDDFGELGQALAQELVNGGPTPLWTTLSSQLVAERAGTSDPSVEGAVVVRSWTPSDDADADPADLRATASLVQGLLSGLGQAGVPAVGVETTSDDTSIEVFREQGVSSVDDIDTAAGRIALAFLLAGGEPGHYGVKDSASDGVAPPLESLPALAGD